MILKNQKLKFSKTIAAPPGQISPERVIRLSFTQCLI